MIMPLRAAILLLVLFVSVGLTRAQMDEPVSVTNAPAYDAAARYSARNNHDAFLVYRDGVLVYETYNTRTYNPTDPHVLYSGTKSFSCAIAVRAQMDGRLTLDEPVADTITEWAGDPQKETITIRHLLNLTDGLPGRTRSILVDRRGNALERALNADLVAAPGTTFDYGPTHFFIFAELIRRKLDGEDTAAYLARAVLEPIGMNVAIGTDDSGNIDLGAGGMTTARDWARYGQLILQEGRWNNKQLLDAAALRDCFVASSANIHYGLSWWLIYDRSAPTDIDVLTPVPDAPDDGINLGETIPDVIVAGGAQDQRLFIIPAEGLVVVRFARGGLRYSDAELIRLLMQG